MSDTPTLVPCKLCHRLAELRSSHIIPEFSFTPLYDEKHGAVENTVDTASQRIIRKGYREKLLCEACEGKFSALESYFTDRWIWRSVVPAVLPNGPHHVKGLDYARFKLFHLSVLWRAGVSTRKEFNLIRLGPYLEKLRVKLLAHDPGPPDEFGIAATALVDPDTRAIERAFVVQPERVKVRGTSFCIFTFAGFGWYYAVSHRVPAEIAVDMLRDDGSLLLDVIAYTDYPPLIRTFARLQQSEARANRADE